MEETFIFPSPNWFQVSGLTVSTDNWIIYGGPSRSLVVLKPLEPTNDEFKENLGYQAYVIAKSHSEKIVSVDLSREWPEKRLFLTGSIDGLVKQWKIEHINKKIKIKSTHSLDIHRQEKEEIVGVAYSSEPFAVTVGCFGNIVKWDLNTNIAKNYNNFLKSLKPICIACSHHIPLHVAIGTKQGVIVVLDLKNQGKVVYKIRSQDDDIVNVSWCPQYTVVLRKAFKPPPKISAAAERLERIRSEGEDPDLNLNNSGVVKNLPEDSFDESVVQEDDTFDIYTDHAADEFGHKKFQPEDIIVKVKEETENNDFLEECLKLKEAILKKKNEPEPSIANLVDALDRAHVDSDNSDENSGDSQDGEEKELPSKVLSDSSIHTHRHLLATIGKYGSVKIWSKTGKLVSSCIVPNSLLKNTKMKKPLLNSSTLLWYKADVLLIADGKSQLLQCNPLKTDHKNKMEWNIVHAQHKRGLYCIASNAPRVQNPPEDLSTKQLTDSSTDQTISQSTDQSGWKVWTIAQDRSLICYSLEKRETVSTYNTCGGFLYTLRPCPYDAKRIAVSVGDGAVRVWESDLLENGEPKLAIGDVLTFWQNVQGKVLTIAWHPSKENLLAFATSESRIGLIDTNKADRPAKTLTPALRGGIYSLCWGDKFHLYACGAGSLVMYHADKPEQVPETIKVEFEGKKWEMTSATWYPSGLVCGSVNGAVAVLDPVTYELLSVLFVFNKMIHNIEWHPQQTSGSSEESPYKNLIAVSSLDKVCGLSILEYADKGDGLKLHTWKMLNDHETSVFEVAWNPHKDGLLLSTAQDGTARVWDMSTGNCVAIYGGHTQTPLGACWSAFPQLATTVLSGGTDCCLRLWRYEEHPPGAFTEIKHETVPKKDRKNKEKEEKKKIEVKKEEDEEVEETEDGQVATSVELNMRFKVTKRYILPTLHRQLNPCNINTVKKMARKFLAPVEANGKVGKGDGDEKHGDETDDDKEKLDFTKIFGNTNDLNEVLDLEMRHHLENNRTEASIMLSIFRGHIDSMIQFASERDDLCPFLVSLSPCVSFKYWKQVMQMYLTQMERLMAKKKQHKLFEHKYYGGQLYRKVALLLSLHDVRGAVTTLLEARLYREAYVLAKCRHMDSIAEEVLKLWAEDCEINGHKNMSAICYLGLGDVYKAAVILSKSADQEFLSLAADLAKVAGQPTFANHIEDKRSQIESDNITDSEILKPLPSKADLIIQKTCDIESDE